MSEENKGKEDASKEIIENINKAVGEKLSQGFEDMSRKLNSGLDEKISKLAKPSKEDPEEDFDYFGSDEDETVKKSDLEKIISKTKKETIQEIESGFALKSAKQNKDAQALEHFPMLNPSNAETFNKDFMEEVKTEVSRRIASGTSNESPELVYDAAVLIENKWMKQGKYVPKSLAEKLNQNDGRSGSNFGKNFSPQSNGKAPNQRQIELANQFGVSVDSLKDRLRSS